MRRRNRPALRFKRPIAVLDLETTGTWPESDRIVQIGVLRVSPDGRSEEFYSLIDPEVRIPREATAVHGISNRHVKGKPTFAKLATQLLSVLSGCDLAGFNILGFDLAFLEREFARAGLRFDARNYHVIDAMKIFHRKEPRDLAAAYRFYCRKEHTKAHSALADARACWEILQAQVRRYGDLGRTVKSLAKFSASGRERFLDSGGWFEPRDGQPVFAKGKHRGRLLAEVARNESDYLDWMLGQSDLPEDTSSLVAEARKQAG